MHDLTIFVQSLKQQRVKINLKTNEVIHGTVQSTDNQQNIYLIDAIIDDNEVDKVLVRGSSVQSIQSLQQLDKVLQKCASKVL
ncbi:LSM domain-containing protein [Spironucleus salmonicida]|uniref:LSM domain-containing protein n=1 Tax=Spironucleus salmonicida TaxID=348837 RepID=V6LRN6_9EUKA|nr:LSM domain-containing protein [Spironucleus salmonicida]|eukprot:EST47322.1 LSM domain-containing protein [Spironucleus salmonicida]